MPNETQPYLNVNGEALTIDDAWLGESLLYTLRERLGRGRRDRRLQLSGLLEWRLVGRSGDFESPH